MRLNACHNRRPFKSFAVIQDGWFMDGVTRTPKMIASPFRMSTECVYSADTSNIARSGGLGAFDPGCAGCQWKQEVAHG